jgi:hypothetical protein
MILSKVVGGEAGCGNVWHQTKPAPVITISPNATAKAFFLFDKTIGWSPFPAQILGRRDSFPVMFAAVLFLSLRFLSFCRGRQINED